MNMRGFLTGLSLMALSAAALEINNFVDADGFPVLVPSVQKLTRKEGTFAMPKQLLVAAPKGAEADVEVIGKALSNRFGLWHAAAAKADEKAHVTLELDKKGVPESEQGYTLDVTADGVMAAYNSLATKDKTLNLHYQMGHETLESEIAEMERFIMTHLINN